MVPFPPAVEDLVAVRKALVCIMPMELVYVVLHLAEYWVEDTTERTESHRVSASATPGNSASSYSLVTAPIRELDAEDIHLKIMRVKFTTVSHDQGLGWGGEPSTEGTYRGWTWFEAAILRRSQVVPRVLSLDTWMSNATHGVIPMDASVGYDPAAELKDSTGKSRWNVQRNVTASNQFREHTVTWEADGSVAPATDSGAGDGANFLEQLSPGDAIAVVARALYPGWCNYVDRVKVTVYYSLA
ncbi:hypothetical protein B0H16DRAFT_1346082 [Mycena metata]|uniref:Uncharacterized protein n=1 Tax=Mycena metata TaxID=1033252 RepID=A0AAD7M8C5_9AGAR|nr:hypothetical protein B0H16DRAFT_1346082 [Mycena metata]